MLRPDAVSRRINMLGKTKNESAMGPAKPIQPNPIPLLGVFVVPQRLAPGVVRGTRRLA